MAERIADDADLAVDELKRKARRRLIGAIVLALAAAVILPLLLEKEPKPLGDDVSVQIPPVDEGRFVNRLTGRPSDVKSAPKADARPLPKAAPPKSEAPPAAPPEPAAAAPAPPTEPAAAPATPAPANVSAPRKSVSEAEQKALAGAGKPSVVAKADTAPPPAAAVAPAPARAPATPPAAAAGGESFAVQIAAFTDDKGANAFAAKLKKAGYASTYIEPVETSRGTLWRVRVGGFATRPDADAARAKLKSDGWNGIVVSAK